MQRRLFLFAVLYLPLLPSSLLGKSIFDGPGEIQSFGHFAARLIDFSVMIAAPITIVYLIFAGFKYIIAGGDKKKSEQARNAVFQALIGLVVVFIAALLVNFVLVDFLGTPSTLFKLIDPNTLPFPKATPS